MISRKRGNKKTGHEERDRYRRNGKERQVQKDRNKRTGTNGQGIVTGNRRTGKRSAGNRRTGNRNRSKITSLELFNIVHNKKFIKNCTKNAIEIWNFL